MIKCTGTRLLQDVDVCVVSAVVLRRNNIRTRTPGCIADWLRRIEVYRSSTRVTKTCLNNYFTTTSINISVLILRTGNSITGAVKKLYKKRKKQKTTKTSLYHMTPTYRRSNNMAAWTMLPAVRRQRKKQPVNQAKQTMAVNAHVNYGGSAALLLIDAAAVICTIRTLVLDATAPFSTWYRRVYLIF